MKEKKKPAAASEWEWRVNQGLIEKNSLANFVSVHFNLLSYPITILSLRELLPSINLISFSVIIMCIQSYQSSRYITVFEISGSKIVRGKSPFNLNDVVSATYDQLIPSVRLKLNDRIEEVITSG